MDWFKRRQQKPAIKQGGVYVLKNCPPLRGGRKKDRPVIVVSKPKATTPGDMLRVVACSTSADEETDPDIVRMPTNADTPGCKTGLWSPCHAVPGWFLEVEALYLNDYRGYVTGSKLRAVVDRYLVHAAKGPPVAILRSVLPRGG